MRKDLGRILTERGKSGDNHDYSTDHRFGMIPLEDRPKREGKKYKLGSNKYPTWNAKVFNRIFKTNAGRPWDDVNSEIRASLNKENYNQMQQYNWGCTHYINTNIAEIKKVDGRNVPFDAKEDAVYDSYWVHPKTGLIMSPVTRPKKAPKITKDPLYLNIKGKFYCICFPKVKDGDEIGDETTLPEGNWFEIEIVNIDGHMEGWAAHNRKFIVDGNDPFPLYDHMAGRTLRNVTEAYQVHGRYSYAKSKRQLSGKEIKKLGLAGKFAGVKPR